jgi:nicotinic acid phosphoribosyltransferase
MFYNFRTEKKPQSLTQIFKKKVCSQPEIIILGFKALCSELVFCVFSEKEMAVLFKNGHFQNVLFSKYERLFYFVFF